MRSMRFPSHGRMMGSSSMKSATHWLMHGSPCWKDLKSIIRINWQSTLIQISGILIPCGGKMVFQRFLIINGEAEIVNEIQN